MSRRSPAFLILGSLVVGGLLALIAAFLIAPTGSEPAVTGAILLAFAIGWLLVAALTIRFSAQPQRWAYVPALFFGLIGIALFVIQPGPPLMDLLSWIWPIALVVLAVWIVMQSRRHLVGRGRWVVNIAAAVLVLFAVGGALATLTGAQRPAITSPTGRLVDVAGGRMMYIDCTGSGGPTVVLQSGLLLSSAEWDRIAPSVAESTTVCIYDRAGLGRSDEVGAPQDGIAVATDLHNLLVNAGVTGPYVVVGHSTGGDYTRVFAGQYPGEIAGIVLVDAQPADAFAALPQYPATYASLKLLGGLSPTLARISLLGPVLGLSGTEATVAMARSGRDEVRQIPVVLEQARAVTSFGDVPLIVLSAGTGQQTGWVEAQAELPALSMNSVQRTIPGSTHDTLVVGDNSGASTQAILDVLEAVRSGSRVQ